MEKDIFQYHNGQREVFGDPLRLYRDLFIACEGNLQAWVKYTQDEEQPLRAAEYAQRLLAATSRAFGLVPFDPNTGQGATDHDIFCVLESFFDWMLQKKTSSAT